MTRRLTICLGFLPLLSCVDSRWAPCDGGSWICPEGKVCDLVNGRCSDESEPCVNRADGHQCPVDGGDDGVCNRGICRLEPGPSCGDGIRDGGEDCDGADLNGASCLTVPQPNLPLPFYEEPGLRCDANCRFDTEECTGWCGDGKKNGLEYCDPTDTDPNTAIAGFCASHDFSAGFLACLDTCNGPTTDTDTCARFGWTFSDPTFGDSSFPLPSDGVRDVWGADGNLIVIVGGKLRWFDRAENTWHDWSPTVPWPDPRSEFPDAIWGTSLSDFWVTSHRGLAHWDGTDWSYTAYANGIRALWGSAADDIFGVGSGDQIHHYDGNSWSATATPEGALYFNDISGSGPTDVYAVGDGIVHFDGTAWSSIDVGTVELTGVWAAASDDVWVVGYESPQDGSILLHFDGVKWQSLSVADYLSVVAGRGHDDVWAAGPSTVMHFDGDGWVKTQVMTLGDLNRIWVDRTAVVVSSGHEVGEWGGAGQVDLAQPPAGVAWWDVWGVSSSAWVAVGFDAASQTTGFAYHQHDGTIRQLPESLFVVSGFGPDDVYATGRRGSIFHFDGELWRPFRSPIGDFIDWPLFIQAVGPRDLYVLDAMVSPSERENILSRFDGSEWSTIPIPDEIDGPLDSDFAMWVFSADDIWAFEPGEIWHFDGREWIKTDTSSLIQPGLADVDFRSVWASGPDDLYALASPRTVWHYDGKGKWTFTKVGLEGSEFREIGGHAADDVFVLGGSLGEYDMAHFDGLVWEPLAPLRVRNSDGIFSGMAVMSNVLVAIDLRGPRAEAGEIEGSNVEGFLRTRLWNCRPCERDRGNRIDDNCDGQVDELDLGCERWDSALARKSALRSR